MTYFQKSARHTLMDHLARRDHSELELRQKLKRSRYEYSLQQIEEAIQFARESGWIKDSMALSKLFADQLHRKNKGIRAIQKKLREKGLPSISSDPEVELEKALKLAENQKIKKGSDKEKIGRFLLSRGFDAFIVRKVIYEKLK